MFSIINILPQKINKILFFACRGGCKIENIVVFAIIILYCEAQARVRQGLARDGPQGERPQSLNPCLELTLKLVGTDHFEDLNLIDGNFR